MILLIENLFIFLVGISIGSFINVVLVRLPKNISIIYPRSMCIKCNKQIMWYDNIPLISWFILKGKCRNCRQSFSKNYILIEFIFGLIFLYVNFQSQSIYSGLSNIQDNILSWIFLTILVPLLILDFKYYWLPSSIIYLGTLIGIIFICTYSYIFWNTLFIYNVSAGIIGFLIFKILSSIGKHIYKKPVLGDGDAKLAVLIGVWLGLRGLFVSLYLSFVFAGIISLVLLCLKVIKRNSKIPFGPFMIISSLGIWFYGTSYFQLF